MSAYPSSPVVSFNPAMFLGRYPEFTAAYTANPTLYGAFFTEASMYLNNSATSVVQNLTKLSLLLNMLTAHIAYLAGQLSADGQARPVGRVSQASEGSVSASFENNPPTAGSPSWYQQSQYGAAFWQATSAYRGAMYFPQPTRVEGFTGTQLGTDPLVPELL